MSIFPNLIVLGWTLAFGQFESAYGLKDLLAGYGKHDQIGYIRNVSLERAWAELNQQRRDGAPQSTVEALVYELRTRGLTALQHPNCLRRLDDVSATQLREVTARLIRLQPKYSAITDDLLLKLGGLL